MSGTIWSSTVSLPTESICSNCPELLAERMRIGREIHDTLMQGCAGVSALLYTALGEDAGDEHSRLHLIQAAAAQIQATVDEAREAITNLHHNSEMYTDIVTSLRNLARRVERQHGIEAFLGVTGVPFNLDQQLVYTLAMATREAVFNAVLHANTQRIQVSLSFNSQTVTVTVSDDGKGFDANLVVPEEHYGFQNIRERMTSVGGQMSIKSSLGRGTTVRLRVPVSC